MFENSIAEVNTAVQHTNGNVTIGISIFLLSFIYTLHNHTENRFKVLNKVQKLHKYCDIKIISIIAQNFKSIFYNITFSPCSATRNALFPRRLKNGGR